MELLEHLDATHKYFVRVLVWMNIRSDDPRIQNHPLKNKALLTNELSPPPSTSSSSVGNANEPSLTTATGASRVKPKARPVLIKKKGQEPSLDVDGIHIVPASEVMVEAPSVDMALLKGKGKEGPPTGTIIVR